MTKKTTDYYDICVKQQKFIAKKEKAPDKLSDSSALNFAWRPGQEKNSILIEDCYIDGRGASEGLKLSFCSNVYVYNSVIYGGYEDCVDIVRGSNIMFDNCVFSIGDAKYHATIKGGAHTIYFKNCDFIGKYKTWYDGACVDLGNWTDYDDVPRPRVRGVLFENCRILEGRAVLARVLHANAPKVFDTKGIVLKVPRLFTAMFFFLQRKGWIGKRRRFSEEHLKIYPEEL